MTTSHMWSPDLKDHLNEKMLDVAESEMPLNLYIFDIPEITKYLNDNADSVMDALASTDEIKIYENKSIRALIDTKWPLIRNAIIKKLFFPYLTFLLSFLYYTVYIFESL